MDHPNIAAFQSYHNFGGMILRGPGREGGILHRGDDRVLKMIADKGEKMLPFYRSMIIHKDLYTVWGGEIDWVYGAQGVLGFTSEIWTLRSLFKTSPPATQSREQEAMFLKYVLLNDGMVPWKPYDHPTYGPIEIGGRKKQWPRTPVSFLLEEECHRNMAFTLYHADQMPLMSMAEPQVEKLGGDLFRMLVDVRNERVIPTILERAQDNKMVRPDRLTVEGDIEVIAAGWVANKFRPGPTQHSDQGQLHRIMIRSGHPGRTTRTIEYLIRGSGKVTIGYSSVKGGSVERTVRLR